MKENWLRTDEREDIIASLRMLSASCDQAKTDVGAWKWIVIGIHSALQSAIDFHLGFGNDLLVARQEDARAWLTAYENGTPHSDLMMDNFLSLYDKLKRHTILGYQFAPRGQQGDSIKRLNRFRNEFTHFMPKGWSIELTGLPTISIDCLAIVEELDEHALCARWETEEQRDRVRALLGGCRSKLEALRDEYNSG
ncbi:MAG: hypothetical protein AB7P44_02540 [Steroidobacteraceae bacterium]